MGGGITYYAMPAIFDSLVKRGLLKHDAWRVTFVIPFFLTIMVAMLMLWLGEDTPTGPWSSRQRDLAQKMTAREIFIHPVNRAASKNSNPHGLVTLNLNCASGEDVEALPRKDKEQDLITAASWELVQKPTVKDSTHAIFSIHTFTVYALYFCTDGAELAISAILGAYYYSRFAVLGQTHSGNWASLFGLFDFFTRPLGGLVSDALYRSNGSLWGRKIWMHGLVLVGGAFACILGFLNPKSETQVIGLMVGMGLFFEAGKGAVFALLPHVHPASNGECLPLILIHRSYLSLRTRKLTKVVI